MSQSSALAVLQCELLSPEGTQEGNNTFHLAAIRLQPLPRVSPEEIQDVTIQDTGPRKLRSYQRNEFSEPRLLHLPIHRKALNSLTWDIWFSLIITIILWCSNYLPFVVKLLYNLAPRLASSEQFLRVTWDAASCAWSPKNKHNSE